MATDETIRISSRKENAIKYFYHILLSFNNLQKTF